MKKLLFCICIILIISSCQSSNHGSILPSTTNVTDKIDDYNAQFNSTFTESQMYCLYLKSTAYYIDKNRTNNGYEFYAFIEDEEKYQQLFTCETLKTPLPKIDFSQDVLVIGFNNKCSNAVGIKQYIVVNDNQSLTINIVTKGQKEGGMGIGFITKIRKKDKADIQVKFYYNYTN